MQNIFDNIDEDELDIDDIIEFKAVTLNIPIEDRETQAAWKLAGLCQLCGSSTIRSTDSQETHGHPFTTACSYAKVSSYAIIPDVCLDRQTFEIT